MTGSDLFADIVDLCTAAGQPTMAASLVREGVSLEVARERLNYGGRIRETVAMARRMSPSLKVDADFADKAIAGRMSVDEVRAQLLDRLADADEALPIDAHKRTGDGSMHAQERSRADMVAQVKAAGLEPVARKR